MNDAVVGAAGTANRGVMGRGGGEGDDDADDDDDAEEEEGEEDDSCEEKRRGEEAGEGGAAGDGGRGACGNKEVMHLIATGSVPRARLEEEEKRSNSARSEALIRRVLRLLFARLARVICDSRCSGNL